LSVPIYHLNSYDWVISMEVAEHIPKAFESVFLDNVCRHAEEGVILSWAVPGQGGHSHINNQPIDYVIKQMKNRGFEIDQALSKEIKTKASFSWLKSNLNVFKRNNLISNV